MDFDEFKKRVNVSREDIYLETIADNRDSIRVKKEKTVVKNLEKIFGATLKISNEKGFQAMTMRDLSRETKMSMGALYTYFSSKEDLLSMLQNQRRAVIGRILESEIKKKKVPVEKLAAAIKTHLYLSEIMQPWFYFSFMEAKNLNHSEKKKAIESDLYTEKLFETIVTEGRAKGVFHSSDTRLAAGVMKAMLQDWYLKRSKFRSRNISVDRYAQCIIEFVFKYLEIAPTE